jgi:hypothetical protein
MQLRPITHVATLARPDSALPGTTNRGHLKMVVPTKPGLTDVAMMPREACSRDCSSAACSTLHSLLRAY